MRDTRASNLAVLEMALPVTQSQIISYRSSSDQLRNRGLNIGELSPLDEHAVPGGLQQFNSDFVLN